MIGDSLTTNLYEKALNGTWQRQQAISNNIANAETPRYKALEVNFESALKNAVSRLSDNDQPQKNIKAIQGAEIQIGPYDRTANQLDRNNVDLDSENVDMTKAVAQYYYLVNGINSSFSRIKYALSEGR